MGDVGEHRGEGERTHVGSVHETETIERNVCQEAGKRGQLGKRAGRATGGTDLEEDVPTGKGGADEPRERKRGG